MALKRDDDEPTELRELAPVELVLDDRNDLDERFVFADRLVLTDRLDLGTSDEVLLPLTKALSSNVTLDFLAWSDLDIDLVFTPSFEDFGWSFGIKIELEA